MNSESSIFFWIPVLILLLCSFKYLVCSVLSHQLPHTIFGPADVIAYLWICTDLEPPIAEVTFTLEAVYRCREVIPYFLLPRIVSHSCTDMSLETSVSRSN